VVFGLGLIGEHQVIRQYSRQNCMIVRVAIWFGIIMLKYKGLYKHCRKSCYVVGYLSNTHRLVSLWWIQTHDDEDNTSHRIWESFEGSNAKESSYVDLEFRIYV
jgi:hypothetical protein